MNSAEWASWASAVGTMAAVLVAIILPVYLRQQEQLDAVRNEGSRREILVFIIVVWLSELQMRLEFMDEVFFNSKLREFDKKRDVLIDNLLIHSNETLSLSLEEMALLPKSGPDLAQLLWFISTYNHLVRDAKRADMLGAVFAGALADQVSNMKVLAQNIESEITPIAQRGIDTRRTSTGSWRDALRPH